MSQLQSSALGRPWPLPGVFGNAAAGVLVKVEQRHVVGAVRPLIRGRALRLAQRVEPGRSDVAGVACKGGVGSCVDE